MTFTEKVLRAVTNIPQGEICTYKEIAEATGNPKAVRAVGSVLRKNFDPRVPCHRVIRSDGNIGNYNRGGARAKYRKLIKEGVARQHISL